LEELVSLLFESIHPEEFNIGRPSHLSSKDVFIIILEWKQKYFSSNNQALERVWKYSL